MENAARFSGSKSVEYSLTSLIINKQNPVILKFGTKN